MLFASIDVKQRRKNFFQLSQNTHRDKGDLL